MSPDELSAAFESADGGGGAGGGGGGMRSLAEEFGLDLGDDGTDERSAVDERTGSDGLDDLQFASPSASFAEHGLFSSAHDRGLSDDDDDAAGDLAHRLGEAADELDFNPLGSPSSLARELELDPELDSAVDSLVGSSSHAPRSNGGQHRRPRHSTAPSRSSLGVMRGLSDDDGDNARGTPTRPSRGGPMSAGSSTGHRQRGPSLTTTATGRTSSSPVGHSRPLGFGSPDGLTAGRTSDEYDEDDGDDDGRSADGLSSAPQMLFGLSSSASSRPSDGTAADLSPPALLALLKTDDRSFALEQAAQALVKRVDEASRAMDGRNRELEGLGREVGRLLDEGVAFERADGWEAEEAQGERVLGPLEEEDAYGGSDDSSLVSGDDDTQRGQAGGTSSSGPSTPLVRRSLAHNGHLASSLSTPPPSSSSPRRSAPPTPSSTTPSTALLPHFGSLGTLTANLLASLSAIRDQSQITLSASADFGRRVRSARATLGALRADEEALERARRGVGEWEDEVRRRRERGDGVDVRERVEREMGGFRSVLDEFEARTQAIRADHQTFLISAAG